MSKYTCPGARPFLSNKKPGSSVAIYSDNETSPHVSFGESDYSWSSASESLSRRCSDESINSWYSTQNLGVRVSLANCRPGYILWLRQFQNPAAPTEEEKSLMRNSGGLVPAELHHPFLVTGVDEDGLIEGYMMTSCDSTTPQVKYPYERASFWKQFIPVDTAPTNPDAEVDTLVLADGQHMRKKTYVKDKHFRSVRVELLTTPDGKRPGNLRLELSSLNRFLRYKKIAELLEDSPLPRSSSSRPSSSGSSGHSRALSSTNWRRQSSDDVKLHEKVELWRHRGCE